MQSVARRLPGCGRCSASTPHAWVKAVPAQACPSLRQHAHACVKPEFRSTAARAVQTTAGRALQYDDMWQEFAQRVSGEWEGVTASFMLSGEPMQLPEYYVPQAYRDWGVELFDWQSQCSCNADGSQFNTVLRRMMPTVGCEADAIAFEQEQGEPHNVAARQLAILPDGSYSEGPVALEQGAQKAALEHCFSLPGGKQRIKVVHNLLRDWRTKQWAVHDVQLHKEVYDGPWAGRKELSGCGGGQPPISSQPRTTAEQLAGNWKTTGGLSFTVDDSSGHLTASTSLPDRLALVSDAQPLLLPLGAWARVSVQDGAVYAEAGVLLEGGNERLVAVRQYSQGGRLQQVLLGTEART